MTDRFEFKDSDSQDPKSKKADSRPSFEKQLDWLDATEISSDETNESEGQAVPVRFSTKPKSTNSTLDYEIHTGIKDPRVSFARQVLYNRLDYNAVDEKDERILIENIATVFLLLTFLSITAIVCAASSWLAHFLL